MKPDSTYNRKFYLIRKIKAAGFELKKRNNSRLIIVPVERIQEAYANKSIAELRSDYSYGLQIESVNSTAPKPKAKAMASKQVEPKRGYKKVILKLISFLEKI